MLKKNLRREEIYEIASSFRTAIIKAKQNREFDKKDRMFNFPSGCCDDACDLLAFYFYDKFKINTKQVNGIYRGDNYYDTTNHVWLIVNDIIIDITADQFSTLIKHVNGIYVGTDSMFYKHLEDIKFQNNYNIKGNLRLWNDYQIISKYID
ncbi:hypothetical protein [Thomasclavelia cocleata]|jgi:hypothetical protein|uniref:hypothetical protein n=1 Tax=Thomasclavelia cocleata TaxID=69824 RepID=UPI00257115F2|nr:hypothetical protein [Thomasclavelia cocleata]